MDQNGVHQDGEALLAEMEKTIPHKVAACAAHMLLEPGNTVLDAGCADGQVTAYFALKYPEVHVIGVDYDPIYIQKARDKFGHIPNLEFIQADLRALDLGERKLDAIMNLSILHEPYSYTGYRTQSVEDIITAELKNLKPGGVIINRDFVLPDKPDDMVYLALKDDGSTGDSPENLSLPDLLELYSREAMRFDNGDPQGHIKGFFLEDHTARFKNADHGIPEGWRVFYLPHQWAWEFGWRAQYKLRFYNEAEEKYAYWTAHEQRQVPEKLGARVLYAAPVENPWIMQNWYQPNMMLFDAGMKRLPLQPSNFISVLEKIQPGASITLREHQQADAAPTYLQTSSFVNPHNNWQYDMVKRPGGDVVDIIPYYLEDGELMILAKSGYPRPLINIRPRMMSQNLDGKTWSGHIIEPLAK
ncbi:MAG TPA: methyltransferase domain-containing protein, partial [Alphaproteobacteria bacterium]|nr:methyltransferase domain-containing protein [Alphaproteobacteria bacterium]